MSLLFLLTDTHILLAMKNRGFGAGRYNGVGGKAKPTELIKHTAIRECQEEVGVTPLDLTKVGQLQFYLKGDTGPESALHVTVFTSRRWEGEPHATDEMTPQWFGLDQIPYDNMWSDDQYWLPEVLKGNYVVASFAMDAADKVTEHEVKAYPLGYI